MSLLRTLDRTSAVSNATHARPCLTFLYPSLDKSTPSKRSFSRSAVTPVRRSTSSPEHVGNFFIQALVRAGTCSLHAKPVCALQEASSHTALPARQRQKSTWDRPETEQGQPQSGFKKPFKRVKTFAERELKALVDYYGIELDTRPDPDLEVDGNLVWNVGDDHVPWPLRNDADAKHIKRLEKLLQDDESPHEEVYDTYKKLQSPGVVYLQSTTIRALLHHLAIVEHPTPVAMKRFLAILDDMKTAHIHILTSEWTSAMHLTGLAMGKVSAEDLQSAIYIWRDMETRAGLQSSYVTLNVLFNIAVKAGEFAMAETFLKQMQTRKLKMHRHHRVSLIYYHGVQQDGNAVRRTYQQMITSGDIVDTVVMNAVIAALIRAGEPSAAEHVFERMKRLHATRMTPAPGHRFFRRTWRDRRLLGLQLTYEGRDLKNSGEEERLKQLQDFAPIAPDTQTYAILMRYHSSTAGNIDRVNELLSEMRYNSIPLNGTVFIVIFHGFNSFGGVRYTSWTRDKLEKIFKQYVKALKNNLEGTWLSSLAVVAALRAFSQVADRERTMQVWEELRTMWKPNEEELENVLTVLRKLVPTEMEGSGEERAEKKGRGFFDEWSLGK
ncbi:pentatricopeptide repeat protein-like protein [Plenodomus tracheiphilus IPT5]|uniref:Pentatricopeptide repeat protein-like protein n=1 Tax=Plenodomus tracheiphilus IPT5 TaxID=1408161 RepID=A0A6A7B0K9_9PLEO|nr:pentatricopeptide repeat protein-like protein [Plenodomus tracheiphilus IPT5]